MIPQSKFIDLTLIPPQEREATLNEIVHNLLTGRGKNVPKGYDHIPLVDSSVPPSLNRLDATMYELRYFVAARGR